MNKNSKIERIFTIKDHVKWRDNKIELRLDNDLDSVDILMTNVEAQKFPIDSQVKLTIESIERMKK